MFVDTSAWFHLADPKASSHALARELLLHSRQRLVTSNFIFDEAVTLIRARVGHRLAVEFGEVLRASAITTVVSVTASDEAAAWDHFRRHDDKEWSFTDCTSFVVMRRLGIRCAFSFDDDFRQAGFDVVPAGGPG